MKLKTARIVTQRNSVLKQKKTHKQNQRPENLNPQIPAFTKHDWPENQTHTPTILKIWFKKHRAKGSHQEQLAKGIKVKTNLSE